VTLVLLSAGCSDGDAGTQPTPSTSGGQSVAETTTPSPTHTVQPPEMPAAAKKADDAGAEAFVRYYFDTVNYAYASGDLKPMEVLRDGQCNACRTLERHIHDAYSTGGRIEGALVDVTEVTPTPGDYSVGAEVRAVIQQSAGRQVDGTGKELETFPASKKRLARFALANSDGWRILEWGGDDGQ
jgi:hypothetical protein